MSVLAIDKTTARMLLYRFLTEAYTYPQNSFAEILVSDEAWDELKVVCEAFAVPGNHIIDDLRSFALQYAGNSDRLLRDLQVEYTYLFINAIPRVPAPPYESVYSGEGLLMGEPVSQVLHHYREAGLAMSDSFDATPDHLSAEFEFMSYLIQQEMEATQSATGAADIWCQRQEEFLGQHLLKWVPLFLKKVDSHAHMPFYSHLAELTESILNTEKNQIQED